uniref:Complex III subunit 9 n=1 Tax=Hydra vulgaris TaxID=6087 RepID=T2M465_HYDVU
MVTSPVLTKAYNLLFKRSSTFAVTIIVGAFLFERTFDPIMDGIWERRNQGKLWNHIKSKYESPAEN